MFIACDIGGTKFRVAKSYDLESFADKDVIIEETPDSPQAGLEAVARAIKTLVDVNENGKIDADEKIEGIVIGIAGVLNDDHSFLMRSPHLEAWENVNIRKFFESKFDSPIYIENDTDIVGLGEACCGAGKGFARVVYITISTGIGGVQIVDGKFVNNKFGFEPGHQILNNETGQNWEQLASGTAVQERFKMHPKDVAQTRNWREIERNVAIGLYNSILHWSPDCLVIGGSMSRDLSALRLKEKISKLMKIHPELPEIKIAELDSIGGLHGGFAFLKNILGK